MDDYIIISRAELIIDRDNKQKLYQRRLFERNRILFILYSLILTFIILGFGICIAFFVISIIPLTLVPATFDGLFEYTKDKSKDELKEDYLESIGELNQFDKRNDWW